MRLQRKLKTRKQEIEKRKKEILEDLEMTKRIISDTKHMIRYCCLSEEDATWYIKKLRTYKEVFKIESSEKSKIEEEENNLMEEVRIHKENIRNAQLRYPNSHVIIDSEDELTEG